MLLHAAGPAVSLLVIAGLPAALSAQLTTVYKGTQRDGGKTVPASAQFSVERGRVAAIIKGSASGRILFDAKAKLLRVVSDDEQSYFDLDQQSGANDLNGMMASVRKQLEQLPKEQRAMAEQMMTATMGGMKQPTPLVYVWTAEKKTIAGYECTMVNGMRGDDKVTDYCGSTSSDFSMSNAERQTMVDMQGYLRNFTTMVQTAGDEARAFQWDTGTDGYPVLTRCYVNGELTLELQLESVSRTPAPSDVFEVPGGYKKMDFGMPKAR